MKKIKVIDLFGIKYDQMEEKINGVLGELQNSGATIIDVKIIGEKLSQTSVFILYQD